MIRFHFEFEHRDPCPFSRLSREFPSVTFSQWSNFETEYVELGLTDLRLVAPIRRRVQELLDCGLGRFRKDLPKSGPPSLVVLAAHPRTRPICRLLERNAVVLLDPLVYKAGTEFWRTLVLDERRLSRLTELLSEQGRVRVTQKRNVGRSSARHSVLLCLDELLSDLTERQKGALVHAIEGGYYRVPRRVGVAEMARGAGAPRTTFGEHLQKAESKLMRALAPYLTIDRTSPAEEPT